MRRKVARGAVALALAAMLAGCATAVPAPPLPTATPSPTAPAVRNPVLDRDFPDPDTLHVDGKWYAYATNANSMNIPAAASDDLLTWRFIGNTLPRVPAWAGKGFGTNWAPEVSRFGDGYVMYFTARLPVGSGGVQCIALALAQSPEGPFRPTDDSNERPFVCQQSEGGSIDPSVFVDKDGRAYLLWKSDANSRGGRPSLYSQPLSPDGLALTGQPARLLTVDARWEGGVVEAPTLIERDGRYYLFYSANDYRTRDYAVGYATADRAEGPYAKAPENPILKTELNAGIVGPGGQDVVVGEDGQTYMLFHAWTARGYRSLNLALLEWVDGKPVVRLPARAAQP